jgi:hypothetical protein
MLPVGNHLCGLSSQGTGKGEVMKTVMMLVHVALAAIAVYSAIGAGGNALLCLNDYQLSSHRAASQPSMATPQMSYLQAQVHTWQLAFVTVLATGLALRFKRPAWYVATGICWFGIAYILVRFAIP